MTKHLAIVLGIVIFIGLFLTTIFMFDYFDITNTGLFVFSDANFDLMSLIDSKQDCSINIDDYNLTDKAGACVPK